MSVPIAIAVVLCVLCASAMGQMQPFYYNLTCPGTVTNAPNGADASITFATYKDANSSVFFVWCVRFVNDFWTE